MKRGHKQQTTDRSGARAVRGLMIFVAAAGACLGLACSSSSGSPSGTGTGPGSGSGTGSGRDAGSGSAKLGAACSATAPCGGTLTCATSGSLYGRCTFDCSSDQTLCEQFGLGEAVCLDDTSCAPTCTTAADCISDSVCTTLTSGDMVCIPNPSGPADAGLPNGACENLGGATGDTVVNGGYRCTPTNNASIGPSIDLCQNGTWVHGGDCTCTVPNDISGGQDPTDCEDYQAPGTAECGNGIDSCLLCSPDMGCTSE